MNFGGLFGGGTPDIIAFLGVGGYDEFKKALGDADKTVKAHSDTMNKVLNVAIAAGGAALASATLAAIKFESSFAGVAKTTDGVVDDFGKLTAFGEELAKGFRNLALEIPMSVNELNKIGELGSQLGVPKQDLLEFTRTISMLGTTTDMSTEMAATSLARFLNVTQQVVPAGMSMAEQISRVGSTINSLGQAMAAGEGEITEFSLRIASAGNQVGLTQDEIIAFSAALASVGLNAEAGGTAFSRVMIDMSSAVQTGNEKLAKFAEVAGMEVPKFAQLFKDDASKALELFIAGLGNVSKSGGNTFQVLEDLNFSEVRVRDSLLRASSASKLFTDALALGAKAYEENSSLAKEFAIRVQTTESQLILLKNVIVDQLIAAGTKILPILKGITSALVENPEATQRVIVVVGELALTLGAVAGAVKLVTTAMAFFTNTNPIILAITGVAAAIILLKNAIDDHNDKVEKYQQNIVNNIADMTSLEDAYNKLKNTNIDLVAVHEKTVQAQKALNDAITNGSNDVEKLTGAYNSAKSEEQEAILIKSQISDATLKLGKVYRDAGIDVDNLGERFGNLSEEQRKLKYDELIGELEKLQKQFDSASTATKIWVEGYTNSATQQAVGGYWKELDKNTKEANLLKISDQMGKTRDALSQLTDMQNKSTDSLGNSTKKIKEQSDEETKRTAAVEAAAKAAENLKNQQKLLEEAGVKTAASIQEQINKYEKLFPVIAKDENATKQLKDKIAELNKELFEQKGFSAYSDEMMKFGGATDTLQPRLQQLHYNLKDISLIGQQSVEPMTKYKNVYEAMDDVLATLNGSQELELGTLLAIKEQFPLTADQAALLNKAIQLQNDEIDNLTELWLKYRGEVAQVSGNILGLVGEMLDLGPVGKQTFDLMSQGITSLLAGSFDPISFGINAVGMALGFLFQEEEKVVRSTDEVKTSLEQLGFGFDATMKMTEGFSGKFQSALVTNFKTQIDYYVDQLTTAEGKSRAMFEKMAADATREMQRLTAAFQFDIDFTKTYDSIKSFNEEVARMMAQYGQQTLSQLGGTVNLYYEQIYSALDQLGKLDPGSQAWRDLKAEIEKAMEAMLAIDPTSETLINLMKSMNDALGINTDFWSQNSTAIRTINRNTEEYVDTIKKANPELLASYESLNAEYDKLNEAAIAALLSGDAKSYEELSAKAIETWKAIENLRVEMDNAVATYQNIADKTTGIATATVVADESVQSFTKTISDIPDINPAINIQNWDTFQEQFNIAKSGIEQLSFLGIDLDTTNADEKILRLIHNMDLYLDKLNPESQAFKEGRAQMLELAQSYYQLAGSIPVELLERWGLTTEEVAGSIDVQTQSVQSLAEGLMEASSQTHSLMSSMEKLFERDTDLQDLASSAVRLRDVWGNTRFPDIEEKMQEVIDKNIALLNSVDPLSQGYRDLQQQVYYAQAALAVLRGEVETVDEWFKIHGITLKEIEPILGKVGKNVAADADEFDNLDKIMQKVTKTAEDLGNNLNGDGVGTKLVELQSKLIDLAVAFPTYLNQMASDMNQFKDNFKTASDAIAQLLYFDANLDFTRADEQIAAAMQEMYDFWQTLEPGSPAYLEAEKMLNELIDKFVELGGALPKDLQIMFDKGKLKEDIASIQGEIDKLYEKRQAIEVQVQIKKDELNKRITEAQAKISELQQQKVLIDAQLIIDMAATRDEIAKVEKSISDFEAQKARIDLELAFDVEATSIEIEKTKAQLSKLEQEKVNIDVQIALDLDSLEMEKANLEDNILPDLGAKLDAIDAKIAIDVPKIQSEIENLNAQIANNEAMKIAIDTQLAIDEQSIANQITWLQTVEIPNKIKENKTNEIAIRAEIGDIDRKVMAIDVLISKIQDGARGLNFDSVKTQIEALTGSTIEFAAVWDDTFNQMKSGYDDFQLKLKQAQQVADDMAYFKINLDTSDVDEQLNAMIFSLQEYMSTLNPDSQAYKDAQEAINEIIAKFKEAGGVLSEQDAMAWMGEQGKDALQSQLDALKEKLAQNKIEFSTNMDSIIGQIEHLKNSIPILRQAAIDNKLQIDANTEEANKKISELSQSITNLLNEKVKIQVEINDANAKILEINQKIIDLPIIAQKEKAAIDLEIREAELKLAQLNQKLIDLNTTAQNEKAKIDLDISAAQTRLAELNQLLIDLPEIANKNKAQIDVQIATAQKNILLLRQDIIDLDIWAAQQTASIDLDISAAMTKLQQLIDRLAAIDGIVVNPQIIVDITAAEENETFHTGGIVGEGKPLYSHSGRLFPTEYLTVARKDEAIIRPDVTNMYPDWAWHNFNIKGDPSVFYRSKKMEMPTTKVEQVVKTKYVVVHNPGPMTHIEIVDNIYGELQRRQRYNEPATHPYEE